MHTNKINNHILLALSVALIAAFLLPTIALAQNSFKGRDIAPEPTGVSTQNRPEFEDDDGEMSEEELEFFKEREKERLENIREAQKQAEERWEETVQNRFEAAREEQKEYAEAIRERLQEHYPDGAEAFAARFTEIRDEIEKRREEMRERYEEMASSTEQKREERRERLAEDAQDRVEAYIERIAQRFTAAIERLDRLSERILTNIETFEEQGKDMSTPRELLDAANDQLLLTHEAIEQFTEEARAVVDSEDPQTAFESVKELIIIAKESIKDAHEALVEAIRSIKVAEGLDDEDASDEDSTTNDEE